MGASEDADTQQASQYWMAALGAWVEVLKGEAAMAEKAMQFFALGMDHWLAAAESDANVKANATKDPLAVDALRSIGSMCHDARLSLRGDEAASQALEKHGESIERSMTALRLNNEG